MSSVPLGVAITFQSTLRLQTSLVMMTTPTRSGALPAVATTRTTESCSRYLRLRRVSSERTCRYASPTRRSTSWRTTSDPVVVCSALSHLGIRSRDSKISSGTTGSARPSVVTSTDMTHATAITHPWSNISLCSSHVDQGHGAQIRLLGRVGILASQPHVQTAVADGNLRPHAA